MGIKTLEQLPDYKVGDLLKIDNSVYVIKHILSVNTIVKDEITVSYKLLLDLFKEGNLN